MPKKLKKILLLATNNAGKLRELRQLLSKLSGVQLLSPQEIGLELEVRETGSTYAENASLKAAAFAKRSGLIVIADDSGLEVDVLGGAPGIRSARYSPLFGATDSDRRALLLENLGGHPRPWTARFRAWVAIAVPGEAIRQVEGICEGEIIPEERGENGFGYDPVFIPEGHDQTFSELPTDVKNEMSHRARAFHAFAERLAAVNT